MAQNWNRCVAEVPIRNTDGDTGRKLKTQWNSFLSVTTM